MVDKHKLSPQTNEAVAAVSDALAEWREQVATSTENNVTMISGKMSDAARKLGWPKEIVEASEQYLKQTSKMQIGMLDQFVEAWQQQLKSPMPEQFVASLQPPAGMPASAMNGFSNATNPMAFWLEASLAWQRTMTSAWAQMQRQAEHITRAH
jgi:hypothetical protein